MIVSLDVVNERAGNWDWTDATKRLSLHRCTEEEKQKYQYLATAWEQKQLVEEK